MTSELLTADGVRLSAEWWPAAHASGTAVVLVHGFTASKDHPRVVEVAVSLAASGYDVLSYDARGHGGSGGVCTLGDSEQLDVSSAVEAARLDADRVVAVGASMGGVAVLRSAAAGTALDGIVTVSTPASWSMPRSARSIIATLLTQTRPGRLVAERYLKVRLAVGWTGAESPLDMVHRVDAPVAVVHGRRDRFVPCAAAVDLHGHAREPKRLELVDRMGHAYDRHAVPAILRAVGWTLDQSRQPVTG